MNASRTQTYLLTRTSVMAETLLSDDAIESLTEDSLEQLVRRFGLYSEIDLAIPPARLNRQLERLLLQRLMDDLQTLLRPLRSDARALLIHWCRKLELYNLKALIRGKLQGLDYADIADNLHQLPAFISLPHEKLLRTEGIAELLRQLEKGAYGDIARQARRVYEEKNEPFSLDAAIDQRYYTGLLKRARKLPADERIDLLELLGGLFDQQNLSWILRYRFNYGLPPAQTYYLLIPFGRQLGRDRLHQLVNLDNPEEVIDALPETFPLQAGSPIADISSALIHQGNEQLRHALRYSQSAPCRALAYLMLRERELMQLYSVLQGKVLALPRQWIDNALHRRPRALEASNA